MLPIRPLKGQFQRPDLRNHRKLLVVDGRIGFMGSQNLIEPGYNKAKNHKGGREWVELVARIDGPDGQRPAGGLREGLVHRDPRAPGRRDHAAVTPAAHADGVAAPGAAERAGLRHREQPAALHRADLLGAAADLGRPARTSSRTSRCCTP